MKRFLIAASIAAVLAPSLAAPSFAQDAGGRGGGDKRPGRGDRGGQGGQGGQQRGYGRSDQQWLRGTSGPQSAPQAAPAPQAPAPQAQVQRQDRGQFQGQRQDRGGQDRGQLQGQRQDRGGQDRGQFQGQGQRNFGQDRNRGGFDNRQGFQGGRDNRFDNRDFSSRRYQGQPPRGGQRFSYQGRDFYRFRAQPYRWPRGYNNASFRWSLNQLLPGAFFSQSYYIDPYQYGLPWAEPGYQWVRVGNDALLIDSFTGMIVDMAPGVFYW
jgi:Ni/Co efflux regulator RcnB